MDNQDQQPTVRNQQPVRQVATTPATVSLTPNSDHRPKLNLSNEQARALLTINNLEGGHVQQHKSKKLPISLLITLATLVIIVIAASIILSGLKPGTSSKTPPSGSTTSSSPSSNSSSDKTTEQINQDVTSCANPVVNVSQC